MMGGKKEAQTQPEPEIVEPDDVTNAQEGRPVPFWCGEALVAGVWICDVLNLFAREAPSELPGKAK